MAINARILTTVILQTTENKQHAKKTPSSLFLTN
jgi:hypothetical protein